MNDTYPDVDNKRAVMVQAPFERGTFDAYETPLELAIAAIRELPADFKPDLVIDAGSGNGIWLRAAREVYGPGQRLFGIELQDVPKPTELADHHNLTWWGGYDFVKQFGPEVLLDHSLPFLPRRRILVVSNPPFNKESGVSFIYKAAEIFTDAEYTGYMVFLLPLAFKASKTRHTGVHADLPVTVEYTLVERPSFYAAGKTDRVEYGVFVWAWDGGVRNFGMPPVTVSRRLDWKKTKRRASRRLLLAAPQALQSSETAPYEQDLLS